VQSSLWSSVKLWAVSQFDGDPPPRGSFARTLSLCLGDSPDYFNVCSFGPHIFTFLVANANIAAELLIRGKFIAENVEVVCDISSGVTIRAICGGLLIR
jgi:hypothetical protein